MPSPNTERLTPTILDRLLGEDYPTETEIAMFRARVVRRRKEALCRDLENLLNTRWRCKPFPPDLTELETSLVNYGIPDFTGANAESAAGRDLLLHEIELAIERFEPRLRKVRVLPVDEENAAGARILRFRIEGVLATDQDAEPVSFMSIMESASGSFRVQGDDE